MGIYCTLMQVTGDELQQGHSDPKLVRSLIERKAAASPLPPSQSTRLGSSNLPSPPIPTIRLVSLEKVWQGLHFLLTGEPFGGTPPLSLAIFGGDPTEEREGGSINMLGPSKVKEIATALSALTHEELDRRFDPAKFAAADIYHGVWHEDREELLSELMDYFDQLVGIYQDAARCENAVLIDIG